MGAELERTCTVPGDSAAVSGLEFHYPGWTSGPVVFVFCLANSGVRRAFCYLNRHDHFQSTIRVFRDGAGGGDLAGGLLVRASPGPRIMTV